MHTVCLEAFLGRLSSKKVRRGFLPSLEVRFEGETERSHDTSSTSVSIIDLRLAGGLNGLAIHGVSSRARQEV